MFGQTLPCLSSVSEMSKPDLDRYKRLIKSKANILREIELEGRGELEPGTAEARYERFDAIYMRMSIPARNLAADLLDWAGLTIAVEDHSRHLHSLSECGVEVG